MVKLSRKHPLVEVFVGKGIGDRWLVPRGFGAAYKRCAKRKVASRQEAETVRDILELVGYTASVEAIRGWPLLKRVEAEVYCSSVYMRAGDNPVPVPPRPSWMGEPWKGPQPEAAKANPFWENPNPPTVLT